MAHYTQVLEDLQRSWTPIDWQRKAGLALFRDGRSRLFLQLGRKCGKTEFTLAVMWRWCLLRPGSQVYYICPYTTQARELVVANGRLFNFGPPAYIGSFNKTELRLNFRNGSWIRAMGSDNVESLRGTEPDLLIFDECKDVLPEAIQAMNPNRAVKKAPAVYVGTPPDVQSHYIGLADEIRHDPQGYWLQVPTSANPHISAEWLAAEHKRLTARGEEDVWQREYEAEIVLGGSRAIFPMLSESRHVVAHEAVMERLSKDLSKLEWVVAIDPGSTTVFGVLFLAFNPYSKTVYALDCIYETRTAETSVGSIWPRVQAKCKELLDPDSYPETTWRFVADSAAAWFAVEVMDRYPDIFVEPSDKAATSKESGISLLKDMLLAGKVCMSSRCKPLFSEMRNYVKDARGEAPKKWDHLIDCLRYGLTAFYYTPLEAEEVVVPRSEDGDTLVSAVGLPMHSYESEAYEHMGREPYFLDIE